MQIYVKHVCLPLLLIKDLRMEDVDLMKETFCRNYGLNLSETPLLIHCIVFSGVKSFEIVSHVLSK